MSPVLATLVFLVLIPGGLIALALRAHWPLYRALVKLAAGFWFGGLAALTLINTTCEGNLFQGYFGCAFLAQGVTQPLIGLGLFGMLSGLGLFAVMSLALGIRALTRRAQTPP